MAGQPIAMGVASVKIATPGDGVPGTDLKALPQPEANAVQFNFSDPKETKIPIEGSDAPLYSTFVKDSTDYVEMTFPTPSNEIIAMLCGGTHDKGTEQAPKDLWKEPITTPDISKTLVMETEVRNGKKVVYTIVNSKIVSKLSQAPTKDKWEQLMVRFYKQAAITAAGVHGYAFSREVVTV